LRKKFSSKSLAATAIQQNTLQESLAGMDLQKHSQQSTQHASLLLSANQALHSWPQTLLFFLHCSCFVFHGSCFDTHTTPHYLYCHKKNRAQVAPPTQLCCYNSPPHTKQIAWA
jgi:hypothetical protein